MRCIRCNKLMFDSVKLANGKLCMKCFFELGFDKIMKSSFETVPFEQIKDGAKAYFDYCRNRDQLGEDVEDGDEQDAPFVVFSDYGSKRELDATAEEVRIHHIIHQITKADDLNFIRRSNNYVSAAIGPTDVARFKFTKKAKWIQLPYVLDDKVKLEKPDDVFFLKDDLIKAVEFARNCK